MTFIHPTAQSPLIRLNSNTGGVTCEPRDLESRDVSNGFGCHDSLVFKCKFQMVLKSLIVIFHTCVGNLANAILEYFGLLFVRTRVSKILEPYGHCTVVYPDSKIKTAYHFS